MRDTYVDEGNWLDISDTDLDEQHGADKVHRSKMKDTCLD